MTSKYETINQNGDPMCHKVGCRKHKRLVQGRRGWFCKEHMKELDEIRRMLQIAKDTDDVEMERHWRHEEIRFRKIFHAGHCFYVNRMDFG